MLPAVRWLSLLLLLLLTSPGAGDSVRELETRIETVAARARPAIACVLVSRSPDYLEAPFWGVPANPEQPGNLGRFDAAAAIRKVPTDTPHRQRILRAIARHDLSDVGTVPESYGSGIVIHKSGLILTNSHVVKNATRVFVRLPDRKGSWADIHASDPRSDLAVLRLLDPPGDLEVLPLGNADSVRSGQFIISIANPFAPGFRGSPEPSVDRGIVSNLRQRVLPKKALDEEQRHKLTLHHYGTLIQTDARATPGCSGGALLDLDGKAIGMTTALAGVRGDNRPGGFAVPLDSNTRRIIEVLVRGEEVEYGFLGVMLQDNGRFPGMGGGGGGPVRLFRVSPGSPAARAGLTNGDVISSVNGHRIRESDDLFLYVGMALAGNTANVEVQRGPAVHSYRVKLAKFYVPGPVIASKRPPARFGLRVDYSSILTQRDPFPRLSRPTTDGVIIREVVLSSPADLARLQPDKIITRVNGRPVTTPAEYNEEIARSGPKVELTILSSDMRPERFTLEEK